MARSIWSGSISFGLVHVPVKLYTAVRKQTVHFVQLHKEDHGRIRQRRVCEHDGEEVPYEEVVKGYPLTKETFVVIDPDELEGLDPEATRTIDIEEFVDLEEIDPIFYDSPYYLGPASPAAARPYQLLARAMRESGKVAIARFVMRSKQYLVALRVKGDVLVASTMNYADEIVPASEVESPREVELRDREISMARQLVDSLAGEFEPEKYRDEYRERVLELVEKKAAGEEVRLPEAAERAPIVDLMAALEESLSAAGARPNGNGKGRGNGRRRRGRGEATASKKADAGEDRAKDGEGKRRKPERRSGR
jgi:DNA end-binding protein Ku